MARPRLNIITLESDYKTITSHLHKKELFVSQFEDGLLVMVELVNGVLHAIMVNPKTYKQVGYKEWEMPFNVFYDMYENVLTDKEMGCIFFSVEKGNIEMKQIAEGLIEALTCLKTGKPYGNYRIRKED